MLCDKLGEQCLCLNYCVTLSSGFLKIARNFNFPLTSLKQLYVLCRILVLCYVVPPTSADTDVCGTCCAEGIIHNLLGLHNHWIIFRSFWSKFTKILRMLSCTFRRCFCQQLHVCCNGSCLYNRCRLNNVRMSKLIVWLTVPCKLPCKDKLRNHKQS